MNIIFITLSNINSINERNIYQDLMRKFRNEGHRVYIVSPSERRRGLDTRIFDSDGVTILKVKTLNIQKTSIIEKGIGTLMVESQFQKAIKKHFKDQPFDIILYSTPPITFTNVVRFLKTKNPKAISYLLLKDIFPQNAVDLGMFSKKSPIYWYFRLKEKKLYKNSDFIGCMSPANVDFVLNHNHFITQNQVEVAPNSIELNTLCDKVDRIMIRKKYGLPLEKKIFIFGGNLGKPQGVSFLLKCLDANKERKDSFFVVVGSGTHYSMMSNWYKKNSDKNVKLIKSLPKEEYDLLVKSCDVGLIFLDYRFSIPNYPSRLLSYLENRMPIICATDVNTDIGKIAEKNGYGYWCESVKTEDFSALVDKMLKSDCNDMGERGFRFLKNNYLVENTYNIIMSHV